MPRLARLDAPGVVHHIMIRGIERRSKFKDNKDRDNFTERLAGLLPVKWGQALFSAFPSPSAKNRLMPRKPRIA